MSITRPSNKIANTQPKLRTKSPKIVNRQNLGNILVTTSENCEQTDFGEHPGYQEIRLTYAEQILQTSEHQDLGGGDS